MGATYMRVPQMSVAKYLKVRLGNTGEGNADKGNTDEGNLNEGKTN